MAKARADFEDDAWLRRVVLGVLGTIVAGGALDLYFDAPERWISVHVFVEVALVLVSAGVGVLLWRGWRVTAEALRATERSLSAARVDQAVWQQRAEQSLTGLAGAINDQFALWGLTPSEREIALLLLKGHGHKQIAAETRRSESTVRQHAVAVYAKSGQQGRSELAAFFLEGLMLPASPNVTSDRSLQGG
jgi:DNA-binding CsgD family transcriptional regulator